MTGYLAEVDSSAANPLVSISIPSVVSSIGRRKESVARLWLSRGGTGKFVVRNKGGVALEKYFSRESSLSHIMDVFSAVSLDFHAIDFFVTVRGGGVVGQAGAVRLALARAIAQMFPDLRIILRRAGYLTRDSRAVERKKYGRHKARKSPQFSKR